MTEKKTPKQAQRALCKNCLGLSQWNREAARDCQGDKAMCGPCPLYPYRLGQRISVKVFRKNCLYCMGGDRQAIDECPSKTCPAYPYRFGTNPLLTGKRMLPEALRFTNQNARDVKKMGLESENAMQSISTYMHG